MAFIACKLPHGLRIEHDGETIVLVGANIGEDLSLVSRNGSPNDNSRRAFGYGLTELSDAKAAKFQEWADSVTYVNGQKSEGKVARPFPALENGAILGPFKTLAEAHKEAASVSGIVTTGFEGLDPVAEAKKKGGVQKRED